MNETSSTNRRDSVKKVVNFTVRYSVSWTVGSVIGNNVTIKSKANYAQALIATAVLAHMLSDLTEPFINEKIDNIADEIAKFRTELKKATADQE